MHRRKSIWDKILSNEFSGKLCLWLLIFISFYYPVGAFFIMSVGVPSTPVNILIRGVGAGIALYLVVISLLNNKQRLSLSIPLWFLAFWWFGYTIRLLYDMNIAGVTFASKPNSLIYAFAFGNILLPIIAALLWRKHINIKDIAPIAFKFFVVANLLVFIILVQQNGGFNIGLFLSRAHVVAENNEDKGLVLNPIKIGFFGGLLSISAYYFLIIVKNTRWWIYLPLFVFGLLMLLLGASRGPFFAASISIILITLYRYRISYSKVITFLKMALLITVTIFISIQTVGRSFTLEDFSLYNRLSKMLDNRQKDRKEARDYSWASAWQDFLDSPIIGKQFVGTHDKFYPHNIALEIPMATGVVGSFFFLGFFIPILINIFLSFWNRDHDYFFIAIIFIPTFIGTLFSGALFFSIHFWMLLMLLSAFKVKPITGIFHVRESRVQLQEPIKQK